MLIAKVVARHAIKIFGNSIKLVCVLVHFVAPNLRFTLPVVSRAWWPFRHASIVPRILWQTNYTNRVHLAVYINYLFNRLMAPSFEYRFVVSEDRLKFITEEFGSDMAVHYDRLQIGAAQADLWRVLVLYRLGGVYLDIDAHFVWPAAWLVGSSASELFIEIKTGEISNYLIASAPQNRGLERVALEIVRGISSDSSDDVYSLTGPGVFNRVLDKSTVNKVYYAYAVNQGNFTNEYFQYIDKPQGKWTKEQQKVSVLRPPGQP